MNRCKFVQIFTNGGKIEYGETPEECANREFYEEASYLNTEPLIHLDTKLIKNGTKEYTLFLLKLESEFSPVLNSESSGFIWIKLENMFRMPMELLHPDFFNTLLKIKNDLIKYI